MALNRINSDSIADGTVIAADVADNTITAAKLVSGVLPSAIANSAAIYANGAFTASNTAVATNITQNNSITAAFAQANTASATATAARSPNRIINGGMTIDQRNAGASVTPANGAVTYVLDRWNFFVTQASKLTVQQSSTAAAGFTRSMLVTSSSAYTVVSSDRFQTTQPIEGFNVADLGWGAAGAQAITLSFRVRSSLTGTFGGAIKNGDGTRSYPFTYTIPAADTFETKSVTIDGDTTGTWATNNTSGILVTFGIGVGTTFSGTADAWASANYDSATGATSVVGTSGATLFITGCQLEKGSTATPFEFRSIGTELALCQRYFQTYSVSFRPYCLNGDYASCFVPTQIMRAAPTASRSGGSFTSCTFALVENITSNGFRYTLQGTASTMVEVLNDVVLLNTEL